jgi:hypothetical protein
VTAARAKTTGRLQVLSGDQFWKRMHAEHTLGPAQEAVLGAACRQLDAAADLRKDAANPRASQQERLALLAFARLVRDLDNLIRPQAKPKPRPATAAASNRDPREALRR